MSPRPSATTPPPRCRCRVRSWRWSPRDPSWTPKRRSGRWRPIRARRPERRRPPSRNLPNRRIPPAPPEASDPGAPPGAPDLPKEPDMAQNSADFAGMQTGLELIVQTGNDLRKQHGEAKATVDSLRQYWSASSANTFQGIMQRFDADMVTMLDALETIEDKLLDTLNIQIQANQETELAVSEVQRALEALGQPKL
ncbi:WXG100 family type VII secretion target [Streptomyces phyllanthi]|uniref:WXG100 family type VII secretion target n=2 Tax=Streptomyces phyllanthi TaxID=1803180 RepID=A0A5N8VZ46_9ACTN|nr:WXG100 family type VII secretion target [Streptomyces phyllanthi]